MRLQYQGIVRRARARRPISTPAPNITCPASVPYTRYFLARILQFQFFKAACDIAGWHGPLHRCTFYNNREGRPALERNARARLVAALAGGDPDLHRHPRNLGRADDPIFPAFARLAEGAEPGETVRLVIAFTLASIATPLAAQAPPAPPWNPAAPENRQVLPTFNYATVETVLGAIGARGERRGTPDRPALQIIFANGRRAAILFGSCEASGRGLQVGLDPGGVGRGRRGSPPIGSRRATLAFNQRYAFSRAYVTADGRRRCSATSPPITASSAAIWRSTSWSSPTRSTASPPKCSGPRSVPAARQ